MTDADFKAIVEQFAATQAITSARLDALEEALCSDSAGSRESGASTQPILPASLRARAREICDRQLAALSDDAPDLATALRRAMDGFFEG